MFETLQTYAATIGILLNGVALGAAWIVTIQAPNTIFDKLDGSRADTNVRELLKRSSTPISGILLAAAAFALLGGTIAAGACSLLAAFGFFSNRWMLAARGKVPKGVRTSRKGQRVMSVSLLLVFGLMILVAGILGVFGV